MKQGIIKQIRDEMHGHDLQLLDLELKKLEIQRLRDGEDGAGDDPTPVNVTIHVVDASKKMPNINPTLNVPQANFLQLPNKFRAFVAGFGSGKHGLVVQVFVISLGLSLKCRWVTLLQPIRRSEISFSLRLMK